MPESQAILTLIYKTKTGDKASYGQLVELYARRLYIFIRRHTDTHADAEDVVQETFLKAYQYLHRYDSQYKFGTWLFVIGLRQARSWYRRKRPLAMSDAVEAVVEAEHRTQECSDEGESIWHTAEHLPQHFYDVLWLKYREELSVAEIAAVTGKSQTNVKVLLHRARKALGDLLTERQPASLK